MPFANGTVAGVWLSFFRRVRRLAIFFLSICASSLLLFELDWSFHAAQTDAPVATIRTIPWDDVRDELIVLILSLGRLRRLNGQGANNFRS